MLRTVNHNCQPVPVTSEIFIVSRDVDWVFHSIDAGNFEMVLALHCNMFEMTKHSYAAWFCSRFHEIFTRIVQRSTNPLTPCIQCRPHFPHWEQHFTHAVTRAHRVMERLGVQVIRTNDVPVDVRIEFELLTGHIMPAGGCIN